MSDLLNSKIRGRKISVSESERKIISGALSLIWSKTGYRVESCRFGNGTVLMKQNKNGDYATGYFDLFKSNQKISALLSSYLPPNQHEKFKQESELEQVKKQLISVSKELEDYKIKYASSLYKIKKLEPQVGFHDEANETPIVTPSTSAPPSPTVTASTSAATSPTVTASAASPLSLTSASAASPPSPTLASTASPPSTASKTASEEVFKPRPTTRSKSGTQATRSKSGTKTTSKSNSTEVLILDTQVAEKIPEKILEKISKKVEEKTEVLNKSKEINDKRQYQTKERGQKRKFIEIEDSDKEEKVDPQKASMIRKGKKLREILSNPQTNDDSLTVSKKSKSEIVHVLHELTSEPIIITDVRSAEDRIHQWKKQESQGEKFQMAAEAYNLTHLMLLVNVYDGVLKIGAELAKDPFKEVRSARSWAIKFVREKLNINSKTEQRYRLGCNRLRTLFKEGITSEQLVQAGCHKCDFYAKQENYDVFLSQIPSLEKRRNISNNDLSEIKSIEISDINLDDIERSDSIQTLKQKASSIKRQKVIFKLRLGEDLVDLADNYKDDEYVMF